MTITSNISIITVTSVATPGSGVNYITSNDVYSTAYNTAYIRDFQRFKNDGLNTISISLYWEKIDAHLLVDKNLTSGFTIIYDNVYLDRIRTFLTTAKNNGMNVFISIHMSKSVDFRPSIMKYIAWRTRFLNMVKYLVNYLKGYPKWAYGLNEPWYWSGWSPLDYGILVKENMITLFVDMANICHNYTSERIPFTCRFVSDKNGKSHFNDQFNWDSRIFTNLDFIGFNYPSSNTVNDISKVISNYNKKVWITEMGTYSTDDTAQANYYKNLIPLLKQHGASGWMAWMWNSQSFNDTFNTCKDSSGNPRLAYYELNK